MEHQHGLNIVHKECEDHCGLPRVVTEETLESLQYLSVITSFFIDGLQKLFSSGFSPSACRLRLVSYYVWTS